MNEKLFISRCLLLSLSIALSYQSQSAVAAPDNIGNVSLKCENPSENNLLFEKALKGKPSRVNVSFNSADSRACSILLHHAVAMAPGTDLAGPGSSNDEVPNASFHNWSHGGSYTYAAPTFGNVKTYSGTGGLKVEHASCWVSNVWGLYGNGYINQKFDGGQPYLNWRAISVEPKKNQCEGAHTRCVDDPDATGFHHVPDVQAKRLMRDGTAGHDISQLIPVDQFYNDWVTVRIRVKYNSGNNKFYVRLIQGVGSKNQLNRAVSHTLPGIELVKNGEFMDYVMITNLNEQNGKLNDFLASGKDKFTQIVLTSAVPQIGHDIDVARISMYRGIGAPRVSEFGSQDPLVRQRGHACNK